MPFGNPYKYFWTVQQGKESKSELRVTLLGTGTSQGVPVIACVCEVCRSSDKKDKRLRVSAHIEYQGKNFIIDTGPDFRQQILREGISDLDAVLMTHEHKDHTAGMDDIRAFNFKYRKDMPVYATPRVQDALKKEFHYIFEKEPYPGVPRLDLVSIDKDPFMASGIEVTPIEVLHYKLPVFGFRISNFAYITDAKTISDEEAQKLFGLDVLVLNALRRKSHMSHLTLEEALRWVERFKPKKAFLTHISHLMGKHEEIEKMLPENVFLAYDGLSFGSS
ncbi:MAG: MBL fold metallo-hydrolase [Flavobacteriales bacterium]|nr:MBL fold metallo-hydrolase [Flavobacteriales bacterium]